MLRINKDKYNDRLTLCGMSNKSLAKTAGISVITLSRAINAKSNPKPATIGKISKALKCKPADILEEVKE